MSTANRLSSERNLLFALNGRPTYVNSISASTTSANLTVGDGALLLIQPSADVFIHVGSTAVAASSVKVAADEKFYLMLRKGETTISAITASGTSTVKVFTLG